MIAGYQRVTNPNNNKINDRFITSDSQTDNTTPAVEALILLNLIQYIYELIKHLCKGRVAITNNNQKIVRDCNKTRHKTTELAEDSVVSTCKIRRLIENSLISITIKYRKEQSRKITNFNNNL